MKKFSKRLFTSLVAFCMLFAVSAVPAFAAETTTEITDTQQPVVIGEYDGYSHVSGVFEFVRYN